MALPVLGGDRYQDCKEFIDALTKCQNESGLKRLFGACNDPMKQLSACLQED
eukprot:Pgem_evm1s7632